MEDDNKTKEQLVIELTELRSQNTAQKRSVTGSLSSELVSEEAGRYAESIVETVREPLLVLDADLKIISANRNFYRTFKVTPGETIGTFIYDLGNKQWNIPKLRELLEEILPEKEAFDDFEVDHNFESIGHKIMLLNARQIHRKDIDAKTILLVIEDITERKRLESLLIDSEEQYRRLFETASDGIVLLEKREGKITHANPATEKMLGYTKKESIGNKLQDIGVSLDLDDFQTTMQNLNKSGITNYRNVKVETKSGHHIDTEIYLVDRSKLVQCNIRDITEHRRAEKELLTKTMLLEAQSETSIDGILAVDNEGHSILFNKRFSELWMIPDHIMNTKDDARILKYILKQLKDPEEFSRKVKYLYEHSYEKNREEIEFADGRYFDRYSSPLLGKDGQHLGQIFFFRDITERKQSQQALLESEERFRSVTESLHEAVWSSDLSGEFKFLSPVMTSIYGRPLSEMIGYPDFWIDASHPEDQALVRASKEELFRDNRVELEYRIILPDGTVRWIYDRKLLLRNEHGEPSRIAGIVSDITSRKQAEEELRRTNAFLDSVVENIPNMIFLKDAKELRFVRFNRAGENLMGVSRDDLVGKNDYDFVPKEQADFFTQKDREVLRGKEVVDIPEEPLHVHTSNKKERILHTQKVPIMDARGEPQYLLGISEDITDRKRSEEALRESLDRSKAILASLDDAVFLVNPSTRLIIECNDAAARIFGYSHEEMVGRGTDFLHIDQTHFEQFGRHLMAAFEDPGYYATEFEMRRKDGGVFPTEHFVRPVHEPDGRILYVVSVVRDITERKHAEEELKQTTEKLRKSLAGTIQALSSTVETRDPYTAGHQRKVSNLARTIAQEMGLPNDTVDNIRLAGIIHDIGKISVPVEILSKPGKISDIEMSLIKAHSQEGYDILKDVGLPYPIAEMVLQHHERLDGSGYPQGLKKEQILLETKIICVADVVEAIASNRPYRPAKGIDAALEEIEKNKGILYDEKAVEACLRLFREKGFQLEETML
jgi:PAS domain S-box-containing protein/putative nucleotidyltransferase with HDIG domain